MCTGIAKLRRAGDQIAIERNQERNELRYARQELLKAVREKESAEMDAQETRSRNMCLARNTDLSICWMMYCVAILLIDLGLRVFGI